MSDLVGWLREQLDKDEVGARRAAGVGYIPPDVLAFTIGPWMRHARTHDPARVLAEVAAKRAIIECWLDYETTIDGEWGCCHRTPDIEAGLCPNTDHVLLRALAQPYADREGFDPAWRT